MSVLSLISCVSNLKSVTLTILELLAFNPPKFRGHVTLAPPPFWKIFVTHVRIVPKNICTKLEDWNFNRFEAIVWCIFHITSPVESAPFFIPSTSLFTVLLVHLILRISPHHSHHLRSHHLSLPLPSTPDLKLIFLLWLVRQTKLGHVCVWPSTDSFRAALHRLPTSPSNSHC